MKIEFSYNGFYVTGDYTPGTSATQEEPGDDAEFNITSIEPEDYDAILEIAGDTWLEEM